MRALVTGARGFAGRHLVEHLASRGDEVTGVDREVDVTDAAAVVAVVVATAPDVVVHLAALSHVGDSWRDPDEVERVNVGGTGSVLEAARRAAPGATVVVVSSADVFGVVDEADLPLAEDYALAPVSPYGASKAAVEALARDAAGRGQRVVVARPFNHVGPGQSTSFAVPGIASRLLDARDAGRDEVGVGDLSARRDLTDVRDVVRAYRLLAVVGEPGEVYHVASGADVAIGDVAARLVALIHPSARLVLDPALARPVDVPVLRGSAQKLRAATGWAPTIALDDTLRDVVDDLVAARRRSGR